MAGLPQLSRQPPALSQRTLLQVPVVIVEQS